MKKREKGRGLAAAYLERKRRKVEKRRSICLGSVLVMPAFMLLPFPFAICISRRLRIKRSPILCSVSHCPNLALSLCRLTLQWPFSALNRLNCFILSSQAFCWGSHSKPNKSNIFLRFLIRFEDGELKDD